MDHALYVIYLIVFYAGQKLHLLFDAYNVKTTLICITLFAIKIVQIIHILQIHYACHAKLIV